MSKNEKKSIMLLGFMLGSLFGMIFGIILYEVESEVNKWIVRLLFNILGVYLPFGVGIGYLINGDNND